LFTVIKAINGREDKREAKREHERDDHSIQGREEDTRRSVADLFLF
jgi:hypothetical protein